MWPDGCGGVCGLCGVDSECNDGRCVAVGCPMGELPIVPVFVVEMRSPIAPVFVAATQLRIARVAMAMHG